MNNHKKKIKSLISNLLANNDDQVDTIVNDLTESIFIDREDSIMQIITESFKGETNV